MKPEDVTLIVPTRNERHNIRALLSSLPASAPLIVVDSSDDDTVSVIDALRPANTRVIRRRCNVTVARQIGAEAATTPWLLFTDADVVFALTYFSVLARIDAGHPRLGLVYGAKQATDRYLGYHRWFTRGQRLFAALNIPAATGSNMLISRRAFDAVGGFDLRLICNEDSEIAWRIARAGFQTRFARELCVFSRDHRRLERGVWGKAAHSSLRCGLLYLNLIPSRWRGRDWGYWRGADSEAPRAPTR